MKQITIASCAMMMSCSSIAELRGQSDLDRTFSLASSIRLVERLAGLEECLPSANKTAHGCLLLCGGSLLPRSILETFHHRGGGVDGNLVIIPTASPRSDLGDFTRHIAMWQDFQWNRIEIMHIPRREAASDEVLRELIRNASAVWIAGGDQQRLADRIRDTPIQAELMALVARGGILGGTSAGAAITSKIMISGGITHPSFTEGWGMLPNIIVDQHFAQRGRFERLARAVRQYPERVGVGIDESTGILFDREGLQVIGRGSVYVYRSVSDEISVDAVRRKSASAEWAPMFSGVEMIRYNAGSLLHSR
jgi:cyanophycinase